MNVSVKISALYSQMNPADPEDAIAHLAPKLRPILRHAKELGAFVNFDMESYAHKNATLELFKRLFTEDEFRNWPHAGIVIQAYLRDAEEDLRDLIAWGRQRGARFTVRLVKGAYWDYERIKSAQNGWPVPVWQPSRYRRAPKLPLGCRPLLLAQLPVRNCWKAFSSSVWCSYVHSASSSAGWVWFGAKGIAASTVGVSSEFTFLLGVG